MRVSREGHPGVVEIALDQLSPQSIARVFSVSLFNKYIQKTVRILLCMLLNDDIVCDMDDS